MHLPDIVVWRLVDLNRCQDDEDEFSGNSSEARDVATVGGIEGEDLESISTSETRQYDQSVYPGMDAISLPLYKRRRLGRRRVTKQFDDR